MPGTQRAHGACRKCSGPIPRYIDVDGQRRRVQWGRLYCFTCSPWGARNSQLERLRQDGLKTCTRCQKNFPREVFARRKNRRALEPWCPRCETEVQAARRDEIKRQAVDYLGGACIACGYDRCLDALDFHHRDPAVKAFEITASHIMRLEALIHELDKCDLLCRNCHAERHARPERFSDHLDAPGPRAGTA